jgi:hypothetical protein
MIWRVWVAMAINLKSNVKNQDCKLQGNGFPWRAWRHMTEPLVYSAGLALILLLTWYRDPFGFY